MHMQVCVFVMHLDNKPGPGFISGEIQEESMGRNQRQFSEGDLTQGVTENQSSSSELMGFSHLCLERCRCSLTTDQ